MAAQTADTVVEMVMAEMGGVMDALAAGAQGQEAMMEGTKAKVVEGRPVEVMRAGAKAEATRAGPKVEATMVDALVAPTAAMVTDMVAAVAKMEAKAAARLGKVVGLTVTGEAADEAMKAVAV